MREAAETFDYRYAPKFKGICASDRAGNFQVLIDIRGGSLQYFIDEMDVEVFKQRNKYVTSLTHHKGRTILFGETKTVRQFVRVEFLARLVQGRPDLLRPESDSPGGLDRPIFVNVDREIHHGPLWKVAGGEEKSDEAGPGSRSEAVTFGSGLLSSGTSTEASEGIEVLRSSSETTALDHGLGRVGDCSGPVVPTTSRLGRAVDLGPAGKDLTSASAPRAEERQGEDRSQARTDSDAARMKSQNFVPLDPKWFVDLEFDLGLWPVVCRANLGQLVDVVLEKFLIPVLENFKLVQDEDECVEKKQRIVIWEFGGSWVLAECLHAVFQKLKTSKKICIVSIQHPRDIWQRQEAIRMRTPDGVEAQRPAESKTSAADVQREQVEWFGDEVTAFSSGPVEGAASPEMEQRPDESTCTTEPLINTDRHTTCRDASLPNEVQQSDTVTRTPPQEVDDDRLHAVSRDHEEKNKVAETSAEQIGDAQGRAHKCLDEEFEVQPLTRICADVGRMPVLERLLVLARKEDGFQFDVSQQTEVNQGRGMAMEHMQAWALSRNVAAGGATAEDGSSGVDPALGALVPKRSGPEFDYAGAAGGASDGEEQKGAEVDDQWKKKLKTLFKQLAKKWHPDKSRDTWLSAKFQEAAKSYAQLVKGEKGDPDEDGDHPEATGDATDIFGEFESFSAEADAGRSSAYGDPEDQVLFVEDVARKKFQNYPQYLPPPDLVIFTYQDCHNSCVRRFIRFHLNIKHFILIVEHEIHMMKKPLYHFARLGYVIDLIQPIDTSPHVNRLCAIFSLRYVEKRRRHPGQQRYMALLEGGDCTERSLLAQKEQLLQLANPQRKQLSSGRPNLLHISAGNTPDEASRTRDGGNYGGRTAVNSAEHIEEAQALLAGAGPTHQPGSSPNQLTLAAVTSETTLLEPLSFSDEDHEETRPRDEVKDAEEQQPLDFGKDKKQRAALLATRQGNLFFNVLGEQRRVEEDEQCLRLKAGSEKRTRKAEEDQGSTKKIEMQERLMQVLSPADGGMRSSGTFGCFTSTKSELGGRGKKKDLADKLRGKAPEHAEPKKPKSARRWITK
ncbi:unnamed protein product [Amoebophrya sp. A120]|nr:unnamed protein product [Amoebophrya sp. A120]|eukprot:GSA120T00025253001.1